MLIRTSNQKYPITVTKLLVQPGEEIKRFQPIFRYTWTTQVREGDKYGDEKIVDKEFPEDFKSEVDGTVEKWHIKVGDVLTRPGWVKMSHKGVKYSSLTNVIGATSSMWRSHARTRSCSAICAPIAVSTSLSTNFGHLS